MGNIGAGIGLFKIEGGSMTFKRITNEVQPDPYQKEGRLAYAPSFSFDDRSILYTVIGYPDRGIFSTDITTGATTSVYTTDKSGYLDYLDLSGGLSLCVNNVSNSSGKRSVVFLIDNGNAINCIEENESEYDIKAWSEDRKTLLLFQRRLDAQTKRFVYNYYIMKIGHGEYRYTRIPVDDGYSVQNAMLSPDGSYIISCESKDATVGQSLAKAEKQLTLYDISSGKKTTLYSSDEMFGCIAAGNSMYEAIHIMKKGKLLIWFEGGYRLYQLK